MLSMERFTSRSTQGTVLRPSRVARLDIRSMAGANPQKPKDTRDAGRKEKKGFFANIAESAGSSRVKSETDRKLLRDAQKGMGKKGGQEKLSDEQARALRRKVGGTYRDFMKDWIEADEVDAYKGSGVSNARKGIPTLITIVVAVAVALGVVLSQTANEPSFNPNQSTAEQQQDKFSDSAAAKKAAETGV